MHRLTLLFAALGLACSSRGANGVNPSGHAGGAAQSGGSAGALSGGSPNSAGGDVGGAATGGASGGATGGVGGGVNAGGSGGAPPDPFKTDNLLINGDAENGVNAWSAVGGLAIQVQTYGTTGYPAAADPGPFTRGSSFFYGGNAASADARQVVDLAPLADEIAAGARFTLSAYLGGFITQDDRASVVMRLLADDGTPLTSVTLGGPYAAERIGATGAMDGKVPLATRSADVHLVMTRASGSGNDGYADDISLVLHN